jgi:crotonobetainyl-CoA:carnitine CoA-transferase CaiB-like acyl-CoA transferase
VLVENLGPDEQLRHGLSPAEVRARHPHLVHVAIADFGLAGPRAHWRLEPLPAFAASGALFASGFPDRPPCWLPGHVAHDCAAVFAAIGALAAVLDRARHGEGQTVEVSVQEAALHGLTPWSIPLADYTRLYPLLPASPPRNADGNYHVLPVADGFVRVLPGTPRQWKAFQTLLGGPDELAGPEWELIVYRVLYVETIRRVASAALCGRARAEVVREGRRLGVPIAPMNTPEEFVTEEQTRARGYFRRTDFPHLAEAPFAPAPFGFSATPVVLARPAPPPGATADFPPRTVAPPPGGDGPVLGGIRVLDFGVVAVGPEVGWVLAELGAEVIKVESRARLDPLREVTLEPDAPDRAFTFNDECRGQLSVCLDLGTARGRELARALCARADVVIENYRGGVMRAWGLDYEDVRRVRPDVVYLSSQGYGRTGPLGALQGFGPLNAAFSGAGWLWNHADAPYPAASSLNHPDHIASKLGAVAVLAALEHRRRTGEGQLIDLAQTEAAAYLLGEFYLQQPCTGRPARPQGNAVDHACPHGVYPCRGEDRWCAIAVVGDDAWERLCGALGWAAEPALATLARRVAVRDDLDARLGGWTAAREAEAVAAILQAAGVSAMPVLGPDDLRADAHLAARGAIVTVEHPEVGPERHAGNPLRMSRTPLVVAGPAPLLGQHTEEVLTRVLGLSVDELQRLAADGVCR